MGGPSAWFMFGALCAVVLCALIHRRHNWDGLRRRQLHLIELAYRGWHPITHVELHGHLHEIDLRYIEAQLKAWREDEEAGWVRRSQTSLVMAERSAQLLREWAEEDVERDRVRGSLSIHEVENEVGSLSVVPERRTDV